MGKGSKFTCMVKGTSLLLCGEWDFTLPESSRIQCRNRWWKEQMLTRRWNSGTIVTPCASDLLQGLGFHKSEQSL